MLCCPNPTDHKFWKIWTAFFFFLNNNLRMFSCIFWLENWPTLIFQAIVAFERIGQCYCCLSCSTDHLSIHDDVHYTLCYDIVFKKEKKKRFPPNRPSWFFGLGGQHNNFFFFALISPVQSHATLQSGLLKIFSWSSGRNWQKSSPIFLLTIGFYGREDEQK